jgi:diguanylate cyclase (GGDEF)-like protein
VKLPSPGRPFVVEFVSMDVPPTPSKAPTPALRMAAAAAVAALASGGAAAALPDSPWLAAAAAALVAGLAAWPQRGRVAPAPVEPAAVVDASLRDPETGMFHRAAFLALAERDWLRAGRYGGDVALLLVEVDRLRQMTEQFGPRVADALLGGLGRQIQASLRAADLVARFDDAQLAVFLPQADATGALDVADRMRDLVEHLQMPGLPDSARFTASVGVAVLRPLHQPLSALVGHAQQALQQARQAGGNCIRSANVELAWIGTPAPAANGPARPSREP